jgi:serine/threonine protein kinase
MVGLSLIEACKQSDPSEVGRYPILAFLGVGGFGTVYAARAGERTDELVAIKVVHSHIARLPDFRPRLEREIAAIRRVQSRYVPRFIDSGPGDERPWLATELIPGLSLNRIVDKCGPLPESAVWRLGAGIITGLTAIHDAKLVHRDLKPQNVLVTPEGPRIIDFSLVQLADLPRLPSSRLPMASYQYAAPEQLLRGLHAAARPADVFGFGATLLFAVTGHPPHDADNQEELIYRAQEDNADLADLPRGIYHLVEQCLYRAPDARPSLAWLREEFARRVESEDAPGNDSFVATLPTEVGTLLEEYREELAEVARVGRARSADPSPPARPPRLTVPDRLPATVGSTDSSPRLLPGIRPAAEPVDPADALFASSAGGELITIAADPDASQHDYSVRWSRSFGSWIRAPVTVGGDMATVACLNGTLAMLSTDDGTVLWSR